MAATGTVALTNQVKTRYDADFYLASQSMVYWDQFPDIKEAPNGLRGQTHEFIIGDSLQPTTTPLDELTDVSTQSMRSAAVSITLQEYGGALELTKFLAATSYVDVYEQAAKLNGYSLAETFDLLARAVFGQGGRQFFPAGVTARSGVNGVTTASHRATAAQLQKFGMFARNWGMPLYEDGSCSTVIHPFPYYDLLQDPTIQAMSQLQRPEILFNGELGYYAGIRMIVAPSAKAFYGAGGAQASAVATTLNGAVAVGDSTMVVASATNISVGQWLAVVDTVETGNTWADTNELGLVTGVSGTTITMAMLQPGPGDGGGFRYAHSSGKTVSNAAVVFPMVMFGPNSVCKAYSSFTGPYGESVVSGPFDRLGRFLTFGWYAIIGYARTRTGWLLRPEFGSSLA